MQKNIFLLLCCCAILAFLLMYSLKFDQVCLVLKRIKLLEKWIKIKLLFEKFLSVGNFEQRAKHEFS